MLELEVYISVSRALIFQQGKIASFVKLIIRLRMHCL